MRSHLYRKTNMIDVYFNCLIDTETHPEIENISKKVEMLKIASTLTPNRVSARDWEPNSYLVFSVSEVIRVDKPEDSDLEDIINNLKPQCPDAEFSSFRRVKA